MSTITAGACRSCGAPVFWLNHRGTGKRAPIAATPSPKGNIAVDLEAGTYWHPEVLLGELYLNHFADCPHAGRWHR